MSKNRENQTRSHKNEVNFTPALKWGNRSLNKLDATEIIIQKSRERNTVKVIEKCMPNYTGKSIRL